jgi:hypothetical protein
MAISTSLYRTISREEGCFGDSRLCHGRWDLGWGEAELAMDDH